MPGAVWDEQGSDEEIKVTDRRLFNREGDRRPAAAAPPSPPAPERPPGGDLEPDADIVGAPSAGGPDFATLVLGLANTAWIHLGEIHDPAVDRPTLDLPAAREVIDLLGTLREKTSGNLTADEQNLLDSLLFKLRIDFAQRASAR